MVSPFFLLTSAMIVIFSCKKECQHDPQPEKDCLKVEMGIPTYSNTASPTGDFIKETYNIPLAITAECSQLFIGKMGQLGSSTGTNAISFETNSSTAPNMAITTNPITPGVSMFVTFTSSNAPTDGSGYRLDKSVTNNFNLIVTLMSTAKPGNRIHFFRLVLNNIQTFTNNALTFGSKIQPLIPVEKFRTEYKAISGD